MQLRTRTVTCEVQVTDMAAYLGIDPEQEPGLLPVARMAVCAPLPPGWQQVDHPDGFVLFR